jgi:hypothetical protein
VDAAENHTRNEIVERPVIMLEDAAWAEFLALLDRPIAHKPTLEALFMSESIFSSESSGSGPLGERQMSKNVIVRYRVRPETADENARLVEDVYTALAELEPSGFRYTTYRLADGVTFVHVASHDAADNPLTSLPAFAEFQRELAQRCAEPPAPSEATVVGSYGRSA